VWARVFRGAERASLEPFSPRYVCPDLQCIESLTTPVAAASMTALPSGAGNKNAEDASIKNDESAAGGGGTNDEAETIVSMLAAFKELEQ